MLAFIKGFVVAAALNAFIMFVGINALAPPLSHYKTRAIVFAAAIGAWQWLYLGPLVVRAWRASKRAYAFGLIAAGAVAILLVSPCFGFMGAETYAREHWQRGMVRAVEDPNVSAEAFSAALGEKPDLSAPLWSTDGMPRSPLDAAVHAENLVATRILLERHAWIEEPIYTPQDGQRHRPLFLAIQGCAPEIATLLIEKGASQKFTSVEMADLVLVEKHCAGKQDSEKKQAALMAIVQSLEAGAPARP